MSEHFFHHASEASGGTGEARSKDKEPLLDLASGRNRKEQPLTESDASQAKAIRHSVIFGTGKQLCAGLFLLLMLVRWPSFCLLLFVILVPPLLFPGSAVDKASASMLGGGECDDRNYRFGLIVRGQDDAERVTTYPAERRQQGRHDRGGQHEPRC